MLAFSLQAVFGAAMAMTLTVFLPKFYVDDVLLPAGLLAISVAVARAFDAITDPMMGFVSDHTHSRWGRRRPWIVVGVLGNSILYVLLLSPPEGTVGTLSWWFGACFVVSFLFVTVANIPRVALSVELTFDARERMRLYAMISLMVGIGLVLGAIMPSVVMAAGVTEPRAKMAALARLYVVGYLLTNLWFLLRVRERPDFVGRGHNPFVPGVRRALRSRPFRVMFGSHVITAIPFAIPATLMPFFVEYVIRPDDPDKWTGILVLTYLTSGVCFLPVWTALARRLGKRTVWLVVSFVGVTGGASLFLVGPGDTGLALCIEAYVGTQSAAWLFLGGAMHADVVDYDELHTGKRREAQFSALWSIIPKFAMIPGASLPVAILAAAGYVPNAVQTPDVVLTLRVLFALVPAAFNAIGLSIMWWYPLTEAVHRDVLRGIDAHRRGESATDPLTGAIIAPVAHRAVSEDTAWFLDHFSRGELEAAARGRPGRVVLRTVGLLALFVALVIGSAAYAYASVATLETKPGVDATVAVVVSGLSLAGVLFQLLKLRRARELGSRGVAPGTIRAHLDASATGGGLPDVQGLAATVRVEPGPPAG
jgi:GPH family glycoside/pentoside/hexuronide:cation symporter